MNDHPDRSVRALPGLSVDHPAPYGIPGLIRVASERTPDAVAGGLRLLVGAGALWTPLNSAAGWRNPADS